MIFFTLITNVTINIMNSKKKNVSDEENTEKIERIIRRDFQVDNDR